MNTDESPPPSTHGADGPNGRGAGGQFGPGNRHGKGNPPAGRAAKLRALMLARVKPKDLAAVVDSLVAQAKGGDLAAIRELPNRVIGTPVAQDVEERLSMLEQSLAQREER